MRIERWVSLVGLGASLVLAGCGDGDGDDAPKPPPQGLEESVRAAVARSLGNGFATAYSVAVWKDGAVIYAEAFGDKDADGTPATTQTLFQIGSDTKKLTALALLREVEAGSVTLEQSVAELLPELELAAAPDYFESVTVRDLLRQTTGLYDYAPFSEAPDDDELASIVYGKFAENEAVLMPPGIAYRYSNPNYALAGLITETLAGRPWADVVAEDVIAPLGLSHTYQRRADMLAAETDVASGHGIVTPLDFFDPFDVFGDAEPELGWVAPEEQLENSFTRPAGLVWSTPTDQANLLGFFIDGDPSVLSDELRHEMMSEQTPTFNHVSGVGYGYGFAVQSFYPTLDGAFHAVPFVLHDGGTLTMTSLSFLLPEQRVAVSVLANGRTEDVYEVTAVALEAAAGELPDKIAPPRIIDPPSKDLSVYAGSYTDPHYGDITISLDGDDLTIDVPSLTALGVEFGALEPLGKDLFIVDVDGEPTEISFYDGLDGEPHHYGVNRAFVLTKQP